MFDTNELVINMGPQHPSTHGVLRVVLRLDGERVVDADVVIGYLHRGIEKLCEHRDWAQIVLNTDRMDYVAAASNNLGYCETVEKLMSVEVPAGQIPTGLREQSRVVLVVTPAREGSTHAAPALVEATVAAVPRNLVDVLGNGDVRSLVSLTLIASSST